MSIPIYFEQDPNRANPSTTEMPIWGVDKVEPGNKGHEHDKAQAAIHALSTREAETGKANAQNSATATTEAFNKQVNTASQGVVDIPYGSNGETHHVTYPEICLAILVVFLLYKFKRR